MHGCRVEARKSHRFRGICAGCSVVFPENENQHVETRLRGESLTRSGLRWELERKTGSVRGGVAGELAVVLVGDAASDGEAEAVPRFAGVESDEAFEDELALVFAYAGSVVCDKRLDVSVPPS